MTKSAILTILAIATSLTPIQAAEAKDAKANFTSLCKGCHGEDLKGQTLVGKKMQIRDFSDPKVQSTITDAQMSKAIKEGLKKGDTVLMKPYNEKLSDSEIKDLVVYFRSFVKK